VALYLSGALGWGRDRRKACLVAIPFYAVAEAVYGPLKYLLERGAPAALKDRIASGELPTIALRQNYDKRRNGDYLR